MEARHTVSVSLSVVYALILGLLIFVVLIAVRVDAQNVASRGEFLL